MMIGANSDRIRELDSSTALNCLEEKLKAVASKSPLKFLFFLGAEAFCLPFCPWMWFRNMESEKFSADWRPVMTTGSPAEALGVTVVEVAVVASSMSWLLLLFKDPKPCASNLMGKFMVLTEKIIVLREGRRSLLLNEFLRLHQLSCASYDYLDVTITSILQRHK